MRGRHSTALGGWYSSVTAVERVRDGGIGGGCGLTMGCTGCESLTGCTECTSLTGCTSLTDCEAIGDA